MKSTAWVTAYRIAHPSATPTEHADHYATEQEAEDAAQHLARTVKLAGPVVVYPITVEEAA